MKPLSDDAARRLLPELLTALLYAPALLGKSGMSVMRSKPLSSRTGRESLPLSALVLVTSSVTSTGRPTFTCSVLTFRFVNEKVEERRPKPKEMSGELGSAQ